MMSTFRNNIKKRIAIIGLSIILSCFAVHAQGTQLKIGHISSNELLAAMPDMHKADTELDAYAKTWQLQYEALNTRYGQLVKEYNVAGNKLTDSAKVSRAAEAQAIKQQMAAVAQQAQDSLQKRKDVLLQPIIQKANGIIAQLADEKGYDYVVDSNTGMVIYIKRTSNDLLQAAKLRISSK